MARVAEHLEKVYNKSYDKCSIEEWLINNCECSIEVMEGNGCSY